MAGERPQDPYKGYNFLVSVGSITTAGFRECSGLDSTQEPIEYREGKDGNFLTVRKIPGLVKYSNVSLKYGVTKDDALWQLRTKAVTGDIERVDVTITLCDDKGAPLKYWHLNNAWPTKWIGASFNATANEVAIETLELAHEGVDTTAASQ